MLYILEQRLTAQKVLPDRAVKVMRDILSRMLEERCLVELFRPQKVLTKRSLRSIFEQLAHSSIMKLNHSAMDKLYDLMMMAVKYQVLLSKSGEEVLLVSLNHLDTIRGFMGNSKEHCDMVDNACRLFKEFYSGVSSAQLMLMRHMILELFQDTNKRVSIFLKNKAQMQSGHFVLPLGGPVAHGCEVPGTIRYYTEDGSYTSEKFVVGHSYQEAEPTGSLEVKGNRITTLGLNMYATVNPEHTTVSSSSQNRPEPEIAESSSSSSQHAKAELALLERMLIRQQPSSTSVEKFRVNLFSDEEDEEDEDMKFVVSIVFFSPLSCFCF